MQSGLINSNLYTGQGMQWADRDTLRSGNEKIAAPNSFSHCGSPKGRLRSTLTLPLMPSLGCNLFLRLPAHLESSLPRSWLVN